MKYIIRKILSFIIWHSPSKKLSDIILWPIAKRFFQNYEEIVKIRYDIPMKVYGDMEDMVNKSLLFYSDYKSLSWEPITAKLVEKIVAQKKCVLVAGAHIGYYPLITAYSNKFSTVYAFEPNPINFKRLCDNVRHLENVHTENCALGDKKTKQIMYFDFGQSSFIDTKRIHNGQGLVNIDTIDNFFEGKKVIPDLMILDAEGYEKNILVGGINTLKINYPDIIFEINKEMGTSKDELCLFLTELGYKITLIDDNCGRFVNAFARK